jgi:tryptophanase
LVIKELIQGDKVGDYVVQQVFLMAASFQVSHAGLPNWGSNGGRKIPRRCGDEVFLVDPAQVAEGFPEGQGIGVSVSKPCGGHAPQLDVGVAVASSDGEDHPTAKSAELLVLSAVVPRELSDTEALQGVDKKASKTRLLLAHALGPSIFRHLKTKVELNRLWCGTRGR